MCITSLQFQFFTEVSHITTSERQGQEGTIATESSCPVERGRYCSAQLLVAMRKWVFAASSSAGSTEGEKKFQFL